MPRRTDISKTLIVGFGPIVTCQSATLFNEKMMEVWKGEAAIFWWKRRDMTHALKGRAFRRAARWELVEGL